MSTLDAFLRRASRAAEDMFNDVGEVEQFFLVEDANGHRGMIVAPSPSSAEHKDALRDKIVEMFREMRVVRYACVAKVWVSKVSKSVPFPVMRPSQDPERIEAVSILVDDGVTNLGMLREIVRPTHGKPYLAKGDELDKGKSRGRWAGLLNAGSERHTTH
jgi:hypothetical protein